VHKSYLLRLHTTLASANPCYERIVSSCSFLENYFLLSTLSYVPLNLWNRGQIFCSHLYPTWCTVQVHLPSCYQSNMYITNY